MQIIIVFDSLDLAKGGGVGSFIYDLASAIIEEKGHRLALVGVVKPLDENDELIADLKNQEVEIFSLNASSRRDAIIHYIRYANKFSVFIKKFSGKNEVIINGHLKLGMLYASFVSLFNKNTYCVETYHNTYLHYGLQCFLMRPAIKKYICVSDAAAEELVRRFKLSKEKVISIPNAVNREKIRKQVCISDKKSDDKLHVLSVGRLSYEKNLLTSIRAISSIKEVPLIYNVIGDGPQMKDAEEIIGSSDTIFLLGSLPREEVFTYINWADIIIVPSLWEGRSIFVLEAAAFDKAFIISNPIGLRSMFKEDDLLDEEKMRVCNFGYLVHTNDEEAYGMAIRHYYYHPELHKDMKEFVRKHSTINDISQMCDQYLTIFKNIML